MDINQLLGGLLGPTAEDKQSALNMGLLQAGLATLANNTGPRPMQALAAGGMAGLQGYQGALDRAQQQRMQQLTAYSQQQKLLEMLEAKKRREAFRAALPPDQQATFDVNPDQFIKDMTELKTVSPGASLTRGGKEIFKAPPTETKPMTREVRMGSEQVTQEWDPKEKKWVEIGRGPAFARQVAPTTIVEDPNKHSPVMVVGADGKPIYVSRQEAIKNRMTPASLDAGVQGSLKAGVEEAKAKAQRALQMSGLGEMVEEAESLLSGKSGKPLPTASGLGTVYDTAAGFFGNAPEGSNEAARLKVISGALTSKMPRMEGPQSDKDTQMYKEMAGLVGDSTKPLSQRSAALEQVKLLWAKYEKGVGKGGGASGNWKDL